MEIEKLKQKVLVITKKSVTPICASVAVASIALGSFSIVAPTERGVKVTLGKITEEVLDPGVHFKLPFVSDIQCFDLSNQEYSKSFGIGDDAAVSRDMQSIGIDFTMYWTYKESEVLNIVKNYRSVRLIEQPLSTILKEVVKDEIGKWSIEEIVNNQSKIADNIKHKVGTRAGVLPINVQSVSIANLNWAKDYDEMIRRTMTQKQEVERMKQEVALIEQSAQKKVKEAEADKHAAELQAEATVAKAKGEAEAKKLRSDADAYEAKQILANQAAFQKKWDFEVAKLHEEKWNGVLVPTYIPLTAAGGIVNLK